MNIIRSLSDKFSQKKYRVSFAVLIALGVFGVMLIFNFMTPLIADDFDYTYIFEDSLENSTQHISCLNDIFVSMKNHYSFMNGRLVNHFFVQLMLFLGKPVFNVINSLMYLLLGVGIYLNVNGRKEFRLSSFAIIEFLMFFCYSVWGQTCLWLTGSCNYLRSMTLAVFYMLVFRLHLDREKPSKKSHEILASLPMLVFGFFAGWTNENLAPAIIVAVIYFMILFKVYNKNLPVWGFAGIIGNIAGFLPMILGPAKAVGGEGTSLFGKISFALGNVITLTGSFFSQMLFITALFVILFFASGQHLRLKEKQTHLTLIYVLFALVALYSCALADRIESRNLFFSETALIIAAVLSVGRLDFSSAAVKRAALGACIVALIITPVELINSYFDIHTFSYTWETREEYIQQQKEQGNYDLVFEIYIPENRHNAVFELRDFVRGEDEWPNSTVAKYYGLDSIKAYKSDDKAIYSYGESWNDSNQ